MAGILVYKSEIWNSLYYHNDIDMPMLCGNNRFLVHAFELGLCINNLSDFIQLLINKST